MRAADEERALDGSTDDERLALAAAEGRIMITFDVKDFPGVVRRWVEAGRSYAGCMIVVGIDHGEFGQILRAVKGQLQRRPAQADWVDFTIFAARE